MLNLGGWDLRCDYHDISSYMQELQDLVTLDLSDNTQLTVCPANMHGEIWHSFEIYSSSMITGVEACCSLHFTTITCLGAM